MKVVICGPPHSGKSVFLQGLCKLLPRNMYFLFRACPDGEGSWTYRDERNAPELRHKRKFDQAFMKYVLEGLANVSLHAPLTLVDVGGVRSAENESIFRACQAFVVLSSKDEETLAWKQFGEGLGLTCLALLKSDLHGEHTIESSEIPIVGTVAGLERGQVVVSPAHEALAAKLVEIGTKAAAEKQAANKESAMETNVITTAQIATTLGKTEEERTLPNGKVVKQLVWTGADLVRMDAEIFRPLAAAPVPVEGKYILDGPAPSWFAVGFAHGMHPMLAALNDPRLGAVDVRAPRPSDSGEGKNMKFKVIETENFNLVEFEIEGGVIDVADLDGVRPPKVNAAKGVVLSGRGPNWLAATLAMGYHTTRWVAMWQPGSGATVAMTHHVERKLGEVIPDDVVRAARAA